MAKNKGKSKNKPTSKKETKPEKKKVQQNSDDEFEEKEEKKSSEMIAEQMEVIDRETQEDNDDISHSNKSESLPLETTPPDSKTADKIRDSQQEGASYRSFHEGNGYKKVRNYGDTREFRRRQEPYPTKSRKSEPIKIGAQHNEENGRKYNQRHSSFHENVTSARGGRSTRWSKPNQFRGSASQEEYSQFEDEFFKTKGKIEFLKVNEIERDLFQMPQEYSLAHCVAEDMSMGSGIAVQFRQKFKRVDELLNQHQQTGGVAFLRDGERFIYYLVTKAHSTGKPTYATLLSSLLALKNHVVENCVQKLAMPRIGCGLDRLEWDKVKFMLEYVFAHVKDLEIIICNLIQNEDFPQFRHRNSKLVNVDYPITTIERGTIILYFSSEDDYVSEEMELLNHKFNFLSEFRRSKKQLGEVVYFTKNEDYLLCGCIVKKTNRDRIDYIALQKCVFNVQRFNKKYEFGYVAFQAFKEENDSCVNYKIINILRNNLYNVEIYVCWVGDLQRDMSARDRFSDSYVASKTEVNKSEKRDPSPAQTYKRWDNSRVNENDNWREDSRNVKKNLFEANKQKESKNVCKQEETRWPRESANPFMPKKEREYKNTYQQEAADGSQEAGNDFVAKQKEAYKSTYKQEEARWYEESDLTATRERESTHQQNEETSTSQSDWGESTNVVANPSTVGHTSGWNDLNDSLFEKYKAERNSNAITFTAKIKELVYATLPPKYYKVCYVSEDMCLLSPTQPCPEFGFWLKRLLNSKRKQGECEMIADGPNSTFCLIVKKLSTSAYDPEVMFSSLQQLQKQTNILSVKKMVFPEMTKTKDDPFDWSEVRYMLEFLFKKEQTELILTSYPTVPKETYFDFVKKKNKVSLSHVKHPLFQMKPKSIIIYWASSDGEITQDMEALNKRFNQLKEFKRAKKNPGEVIQHETNEDYMLCGCVIKDVSTSPVDFIVLSQCLTSVMEKNKVDALPNVAVPAMEDDDEITNYKIVNILLNTLKNVAIDYCWSGRLKDKKPQKNP